MNKTDSVAVLRAADLPALWRERAARKKQCGLPKEAELDLTHAAELEAALSAQGACRLHPRYKAIHPPRSTKPGCICQQVYDAKHPAPPGSDAVTELSIARNELACCDDVPLQDGLAAGIACLREQRDAAKAEAAEARRVAEEWNAHALAEGYGGGSTRAHELLDAMDAAALAARTGKGDRT